MCKRTGFEPEPRARVPRHEREAARPSASWAARSDNASGRHRGSPGHPHLIVVAQLATGQRPMLKSHELLSSLSIASALDEQNDVHGGMVKAQHSPRVRVVLPAKRDTRSERPRRDPGAVRLLGPRIECSAWTTRR